MKNIILFIFILLFSSFFQVSASELCSSNGYTVITINGINTDKDGAKTNAFALKYKLDEIHNNQPLTVDFLYNPTHGKIVDFLDATNQKYFEQGSLNIQDSDFAQMLVDASTKVKTQKLLLVGHSQGNFYANTFYDAVADEQGGIPSQSIGVYGVATPSNHVAGGGMYITSDTDKMIADFVSSAPFANTLKSNSHINFNDSDGDPLGHSFSKIYLPYEGFRIVSEIKTSLNKLQNNDEQEIQEPCISPPELTLTQQIQSTILVVIDPVSIKVQQIAVDKVKDAYNIGFAVGTSLYKASTIVGNFLQNTGLAIENIFTKLFATAIGNQPDVNNTKIIIPFVPPAIVNKVTTNKTTTTIKTIPAKPIPVVIKNVPQPVTPVVPDIPVVQNIVISDAPVIYQTVFPGGAGGANDNLPEPDITAPVIILTGINPQIINVGSSYTELGAIALDETDGILVVEATGNVDTTTVGTYIVTYTASDIAGNVSTLTRTVNVIAVLSSEKKITFFEITEFSPNGIGTIFDDEENNIHTVELGVIDYSYLPIFTPNFTISTGAISEPAFGVSKDFRNPVIYTITAEDGTTRVYTVTIQYIYSM